MTRTLRILRGYSTFFPQSHTKTIARSERVRAHEKNMYISIFYFPIQYCVECLSAVFFFFRNAIAL